MKRFLLFFIVFTLLIGTVSCGRSHWNSPISTDENLDTTGCNTIGTTECYDSSLETQKTIHDIVQIPTEPETHTPINPGEYGTKISEGLEYTLSGNSYIVASIGSCTDTMLVIPAEHEGVPVVAIGKRAFEGNEKIISVVVSEGIQHIDSLAFANCLNLRNIELPSTLKKIEGGVFNTCISLVELAIPEGVELIESATCYNCTSLQKVSLPSTTKILKEWSFYGCESLYEINLPEGLITIGDSVFAGCLALKNIHIPSTIQEISATSLRKSSDVVYDSSCEKIPDGYNSGDIKAAGWIHNLYYNGTLEQYFSLVESIYSYNAICRYAVNFYIDGELVEYLDIPNDIKIPSSAFQYCQSIKGVYLPENLIFKTNEYGYDTLYAFSECPNLKWIVIKGKLPGDITSKENGSRKSWLASNTDVFSSKMNKGVVYLGTAIQERYVFVVESAKEAETYMANYLYLWNEDINYANSRPNVCVFYEGEWMFDDNGIPVIK